MYIVSACLAGFRTRYDGGDSLDEHVFDLVRRGRAVPVCPEQLAGLSTPRPPVELSPGGVAALLDKKAGAPAADGRDYAGALIEGAREVLRIARLYGISRAILKDGSPSCGVTFVYCGGEQVAGRGVCAELLARGGIEVATVVSL